MEYGLTQQQITSVMALSPHLVVKKLNEKRELLAKAKKKAGLPLDESSRPFTQAERTQLQLSEYLSVCKPAAAQDPEFYAHFCSWAALKSEVKDARCALPVIALTAPNLSPEFRDNALAHIASLDPRLFVRAVSWMQPLGLPLKQAKKLVARYLRNREANVGLLERSMLQHRASMQRLYSLYWVEPTPYAKAVLFGPGKKDNPDDPRWRVPSGSVFDIVSRLGSMPPLEAAGVILRHKLPTLVIEGALKERLKDPTILMALISGMSPNELVGRTKWLQKLGVRKDPVLRAAFEEALTKTSRSKVRKSTLKATKAAEVLGVDPDDQAAQVLALKLRNMQEKMIDEKLSIKGDWLVLGDKSGSMQRAIEHTRQVSAMLARATEGKTYAVFFNASPQFFDVTGQTYEQIKELTKNVNAGGNTNIGCGLDYLIEKGLPVDGIAIVSDGGENQRPVFAEVYTRYEKKFGTRPIVYFWRCFGDQDVLTYNCNGLGISLETFELAREVDYYTLPNLVATMKTKRYSLMDEIRNTPLLTLDEVLNAAASSLVHA